jgi:rhodanese-related sulfurtransferase
LSAKTLKDMGLPRVSHIATGFAGWRDDGLPVVDHDTWKAQRKS